MDKALRDIEREMEQRVDYFKSEGKLIEAQRIEQRTRYDMEMLQEIGFCKGIENYLGCSPAGSRAAPPFTLLDYFPDDFLLFVDESHVTLPQVRGMFAGDRARKEMLVNYGFRLPSAFDNRPLNFDEFYSHINQAVFVSATPGDLELEKSAQVVEQVIRPTGLLDPKITVKPTDGQIDDLISEINLRVEKQERVLVTTLTKKMAEDLTGYLEATASGCGTCTTTSTPWSAWRLSGICAWASSTFSLASTCCGRVWTFPRYLWWPFWRRAFAQRPQPYPDHIERAARNAQARSYVRRRGDAFHGAGHHRDGAPPGHPGEVQRGKRHHPQTIRRTWRRYWKSPSHKEGRGKKRRSATPPPSARSLSRSTPRW